MTDSSSAHLYVTLSTSQPFLSLSQPSSNLFQLIVTARLLSSNPSSPVTIYTNRSVLDNGNHTQHDALYRGAFQPLQSVSNPQRQIPLARGASPNYGSSSNSPNLRERSSIRFETVPAIGGGELEIRHDLPVKRVFEYAGGIKPTDVQLGEKFRVRMNPQRVGFIS